MTVLVLADASVLGLVQDEGGGRFFVRSRVYELVAGRATGQVDELLDV